MITAVKMAQLLGRSLTSSETASYDLYLKIARQQLEQLLCLELCTDGGERTYESRDGYRTVYIDPFTSVATVTIDGSEISESDYTIKQNDKFNGSWYNIIEFSTKRQGELVVVNGSWGFDPVPDDLQLLLALMFADISKQQRDDSRVSSKKIEDYTVTYKDGGAMTSFVQSNGLLIDKYSQCNKGTIRHGRVQPVYYN